MEITSCVEWTEVFGLTDKNVKLLTILSSKVNSYSCFFLCQGALVHMAWRMCNTTLIRPNIMMWWSWSAAMQPHIQQTAIHSVFWRLPVTTSINFIGNLSYSGSSAGSDHTARSYKQSVAQQSKLYNCLLDWVSRLMTFNIPLKFVCIISIHVWINMDKRRVNGRYLNSPIYSNWALKALFTTSLTQSNWGSLSCPKILQHTDWSNHWSSHW